MSTIFQIPSGKLNEVDLVYPGETTVDTIGATRFAGQVGKRFKFDETNVLKAHNPSVGAVNGGIFQLVQLTDALTLAPAVGGLVYWDQSAALSEYRVTTDQAAGDFQVAGVLLEVATEVVPGHYTIIQVAGVANIVVVASLDDTGFAGQPVVAKAGLGDNIDAATAFTGANMQLFIGTWIGIPVVDTIVKAYLNIPQRF